MRFQFYYDGRSGYFAVTRESPKGFKGVLYVGYGPDGGGPETVKEQCFPADQLKKLRAIPQDDVPEDWLQAFGIDPAPEPEPEPVFVPVPPVEPDPLPEPAPAPRRRRRTVREDVHYVDITYPWEARANERDPVLTCFQFIAIISAAIIYMAVFHGCDTDSKPTYEPRTTPVHPRSPVRDESDSDIVRRQVSEQIRSDRELRRESAGRRFATIADWDRQFDRPVSAPVRECVPCQPFG